MLYSFIKHYPVLIQGLFILLSSVILSALLSPFLINFLKKKKLGQAIRELGPQSHFSKKGTPTMGGLIFIIPPTISTLLFLPLQSLSLWICLFSFLALALLGFLDDALKIKENNHQGVRPLHKIAFQIVIALTVGIGISLSVGNGFHIPFYKESLIDLGYFFIPWAAFIIISWSNSVNLSDGLDGLAGGLSIIAFIPLIFIGFLESGKLHIKTDLPFFKDGYMISLFILAVIGSILVFLWFNSSPAQIFMGDTGSMALGGLLGTASLLMKSEIIIAFVGTLFILESLSVIIQVLYYKKTKKRFFRMAPLHHHFEQLGIRENKIVLRAWLLQTLLSIVSLLMIFYKYF